ncbi:uncharacterized protein [Palaemon carinicauda]|uniref:uncharacterized protein n=1 Tax=Palaemon carinicauda TaxID=392227 RepID=UPI0035B570CC
MKLSLALLVIGVALCAICANQNTLVLAQAPANVEGDLINAQSGSPSNYERGWVTYNGPGGVTYKGQGEFPVRGLKDTLTKVGSTVAKTFGALSVVSDIFSGVKLVASFFKTKYKTETNENYWEELSETASAMVEEAIDHMILRQTQDAVKRMSENLEFYIDNNSTVGDFSFLDLNMAMDNERETIMSMYAGINHAENVVLQYLDMVTTRLMLWQATALRYISDYTIAGKAPSGDSVCSIVYKWNMAYRTEIDDIHDFLLPALAKWNTDYKDKMDITCSTTLTDPVFSQWSYVAHCKIFDG